MGVILDSSTVIAGERKGQLVADLLAGVRLHLGPEPIALCTVSVIELEHAIWRARDAAQMDRRRRFLEDLFAVVPIHPLTFEIARRAARVDAESKKKGSAIPFQDLIIGVTALEFGYAVATLNVRHFEMIPGLVVHQL
jgi:tRNA(fMet)-specific endonuclease VapC